MIIVPPGLETFRADAAPGGLLQSQRFEGKATQHGGSSRTPAHQEAPLLHLFFSKALIRFGPRVLSVYNKW